MKVLIVGGTRFFGIPMTQCLLTSGHDITIASRGSHGNPFGDRVRQIKMDKTDAASVRNAVGTQHYDLIIDKVAYCSNDVLSLLRNAHCDRYLQMSSCAVYPNAHLMTAEPEFDAADHALVCMDRPADYAEGKRQAERAALECMNADACTFVRYPVVLGRHDYTGRLRFYAEHIIRQQPMHLRNPDVSAPYIHEKEAGEFLAYLTGHPCAGAVNGAASGCISQREIISAIEAHTGQSAVYAENGDAAPYDDCPFDTSYDCAKAESLGFRFSEIHSWISDLTEHTIHEVTQCKSN